MCRRQATPRTDRDGKERKRARTGVASAERWSVARKRVRHVNAARTGVYFSVVPVRAERSTRVDHPPGSSFTHHPCRSLLALQL